MIQRTNKDDHNDGDDDDDVAVKGFNVVDMGKPFKSESC